MKSTVEKINYYMSLPYTIEIVPYPDGTFFAKVKELDGCMTEGDSIEEVLELLKDAMQAWLETAIEEGREIPLPEVLENKEEKDIKLHLPSDIYHKLIKKAQEKNVDLETYIISLIKEKSA